MISRLRKTIKNSFLYASEFKYTLLPRVAFLFHSSPLLFHRISYRVGREFLDKVHFTTDLRSLCPSSTLSSYFSSLRFHLSPLIVPWPLFLLRSHFTVLALSLVAFLFISSLPTDDHPLSSLFFLQSVRIRLHLSMKSRFQRLKRR